MNAANLLDAMVRVIGSLVPQALLIVVWLVGIRLAIRTRHRHPRLSMITAVVCLIFCLQAVIVAMACEFVTYFWKGLDAPNTIEAIRLIEGLLHALLWIVVLWAIFSGRGQPAGRVLGRDGQYLPEGFNVSTPGSFR